MTPPNPPSSPQPVIAWRGPRFLDRAGRWRGALTSAHGHVVGFEEAADSAARTERLPEGWALPGFIDSHAHLSRLGARPDALAIGPDDDLRAVTAAVGARAASLPPNAWVTGQGWLTLGASGAAAPPRPTHGPLTEAAPSHPVALRRADAHALWVNAAALRAAHVTADTPDPPGGAIIRDAHGQPTGLLIDAAADLITRHIPPPSDDALRAMLQAECALLLRHGVTCAHEMATDARLWRALSDLDQARALPLRVRAFLWAADPALCLLDLPADLTDLTASKDLTDPQALPAALRGGPTPHSLTAPAQTLRRVGLKLFSDGALGSQGARLSRPYPDGSWGVQPDPAPLFAATIALAERAGWQVAVHAIGDAATAEVAALLSAHHPHGGRWRIEHVQVASDATLDQMARAGLCAAVQPIHAAHDLPWAALALGPSLTAAAYPWRRLWARGVPVGLGSDHPIEPPDVRAGLFAATRRATLPTPASPSSPLPGATERLTRAQALHGYTLGAAALTFDEATLGALAPGYACDLCVWDRDLTACPPQDLLDARLLAVVVGGQRVI